ncbi:MAG: ABC transporter ATP-binding protein [Prevotellaceae bacterium]|nr:ABC transporter ATP-binding protein [Prevotellaceae bacterium]
MLTNIKIENFKKLERVSLPLSSSVVIIGPNNSGKSAIFQALCLWEIGVRSFIAAATAKEQRKLNKSNRVTLNRKDLLNSPTVLLLDEPDAHLEVIRQREIFQKINEMAQEAKSQLIIAAPYAKAYG